MRVAICTATRHSVSPHALYCKATVQCALLHPAADDSLLQQLMVGRRIHETAVVQSRQRLRHCGLRLQRLHYWLVAPLVHTRAKVADLQLTSRQLVRLRLRAGMHFVRQALGAALPRYGCSVLVLTPSSAGLTLRARESFMWERRLVSTCRSCWILAFSPSSFWICFWTSSRFSRRSSMHCSSEGGVSYELAGCRPVAALQVQRARSLLQTGCACAGPQCTATAQGATGGH